MSTAASVEFLYRPLRAWHGPPVPRPKPKQWKGRELELNMIEPKLARELAALGCRDALIETDHEPRDYGITRRPYIEARAKTPRVQLWFRYNSKDKCLPSCAWGTWHENLKAVALTLERQRLVRDYGVVTVVHQMAAFDALPAGRGEVPTDFASLEHAMRWLSSVGDGDIISSDPSDLETVYRAAAKKAHPDKGGNAALMQAVTRAREYVQAHTRGAAR